MKVRHLGGLILFLTAMLFWLCSCVKVGPDYARPDINVKVPSNYINAPQKGSGTTPEQLQWWELFPCPGLKQVINQVRARNWDIRQAAQRVMEAQARLRYTHANRFPWVTLEANAQRQERPVIGIMPGKSFSTTTDTFLLSAAASYELDLWGRLARADEAAAAELLRAEENLRTVQLSVEAEAVTQYLKLGILKRRLYIAQKRAENYRKTLKAIESRYEIGLTPLLEVKKAKSALSQAEAAIPLVRAEIARTAQFLSLLVGKYPRPMKGFPITRDYVAGLKQIPAGLPSTLLLRRPDVKAAEATLRALNARIGVARAERFPRISLTGAYGYSSSELDLLIGPGSRLWNIAAGLIQPIFDAGKLKAAEQAAIAQYNEGVAQYARTVLNAFLEVENALATRREELERRKTVLKYVQEARGAEKLANKRYRRGLTDYLNLLDSQRTRYRAEDSLALVDLAILTNRVALIRALGGGWNMQEKAR